MTTDCQVTSSSGFAYVESITPLAAANNRSPKVGNNECLLTVSFVLRINHGLYSPSGRSGHSRDFDTLSPERRSGRPHALGKNLIARGLKRINRVFLCNL